MHDGQRALGRPDALAGRGDLAEADRVVDALGLVAAPAAQPDDGQADRANVDRRHHAGALGLGGHDDGGAREVALGRLEQIGGAAEGGDHRGEALGRGAAGQRRGRVGVDPTEAQQLLAERERHLEQALVAGRAGELVDRLVDLERVARGAAQDSVHVGQQRRARAARCRPRPR